jgi:hypothetical protein
LQKRSLYAAFLAAVVGVAGAILAVSRRQAAPMSEITVQSPLIYPPVIQETTITAAEQPAVKESSQPSILILLASGLSIACLIAAQTLLLHSRNPILPLILYVAGMILLQPVLAFQSQKSHQKIVLLEAQRRIAPIILALSAAAFLLNIFAPHPFNPHPGQFQIISTLIAALLVPAVYLAGNIYGGFQVGVIAAVFAAVSGWTLALGKAEPRYISLAIISAAALTAVEYIRRRQGNVFYAIWLTFFLGAVVILTRLMAPSAPADPSRPEQIPANPQLFVSEGFFTSLLMFNLTSDPNPLHGIVDRPVFSPVLSALFVVGLLRLAWQIDAHRRWKDIFLLMALVITVLPSAFQLSLPVRYPDLQRGAMALPVAMVIAAIGTSSLSNALIARLDRTGVMIAVVLFLFALAMIAIDANQHYTNVFLPIYELSMK